MRQRLDGDDQAFMASALDEARLAFEARNEVPVGALVVVEGEVIVRAHNRKETWQDPTAHAEILAMRAAAQQLGRWRLTDATLYVTVEPCMMCAGAAVMARVARVVYGCRDLKAGGCGSVFTIPEERRLNHRPEVIGGVLERDCQALLQEFFRSLRAQARITL